MEQQNYLAKMARLYYVSEMSQRDIARKMRISVASVSRALQKAKEIGIVHVSIDEPDPDLTELEIAMENRWGLDECMLVPRSETLQDTYRTMANRATDLLTRVLKRGDTLGVSWGETLKSVGEELGPIGPAEIDVVPIIGAMGTVETGIYPNSIAREFAEQIGGNAYLMNTPALVDSESIRNSLQEDSNFQMVREIWRRLAAVLLSVSSLQEETSAFRRGIFTREELHAARKAGAVCATNFSFIGSDGELIDAPVSRRITNLPFEDLRRVPHVALVAAGDHKTAPLRAALRAGIATTLISDRECARSLVRDN